MCYKVIRRPLLVKGVNRLRERYPSLVPSPGDTVSGASGSLSVGIRSNPLAAVRIVPPPGRYPGQPRLPAFRRPQTEYERMCISILAIVNVHISNCKRLLYYPPEYKRMHINNCKREY